MEKLWVKLKSYFQNKIGLDGVIRFILFMIPLIAIVLKGIIFQGFVVNQNPYELDIHMGHVVSKDYLGYYYAFALLFLSFTLLFKSKGRIIYLFIIDLFITLLILTDLGYFRGFLTMPSVLLLMQTSNMDNMGSTIMSMFSNKDYLLFIDFIIMGVFIFATRKSHFKVKRRAPIAFLISLLVSIGYIAYVPFNVYVLNNKDVKNASILEGYDPTNTARFLSPIGYHLSDIHKVYKDSKPYELTSDEQKQVDDFFKMKQENLPNNEYYGMFKGKNLIVIQVESLESFVINREINNKTITPVLNELVSQGIYFPHIYEQVNEGTSSDCDLMINTSMFPLRRGSTFFRYPNTKYNSLPLLLEEQGYETAAIHPDKGSFWNYTNGLTGIGFNKFIDYYSFNIDEQIGMGLSDKSYFTQVVPMLKEMKSPFYGFTITLTNHGPFDLPDKYRTLELEKELADSELGGYFESVKYTDEQIGMFLEKLDAEGILDNTVIVIEGDHTGVHKYYNHSIESLSQKEDWFLDNGHHTIPFIIWSKDMQNPKTFDNLLGGQVDIMPTLLYLMGIPNEKYENTALGRNLLNTNRSFAVTTNLDIYENGLTEEQKEMYKNIVELSDKMIRANYLNKE
ncbi:LTA synthase family protein [Clostridium septicum]|uniref:LTA synthase family protein n=1 Tax=Clostridium septicum TaxID=1504 RepID=A0A9N7JL99_CLOSE|nr:LTA synthase family protein [Clostridium septicum]AYE34694.1 sulfatase [Clostridium septicum]MDU1312800.1 LTA synthase family protein [Clostridium septicum]QAS60095.1 LTA synthase family protein [Clostridium septicum]UEC20661.1 LTA synthase family protein [Clostridium septicum]USS01288.1 LTA synthase family protein [Clostridium septicum]